MAGIAHSNGHFELTRDRGAGNRERGKGVESAGWPREKGWKNIDEKYAEGQQQFNTNNSLLLSVSGAIKNISVSVRISLWMAIKYFSCIPCM